MTITGNPDFDRAILSFLFSILSAWVLQKLQPRARVRYQEPRETIFKISSTPKPFLLYTRSIRIENIGRQLATNVEIHHAFKPDNFHIVPSRAFTEDMTPQGFHITRIATLPPKDGFWLEMVQANQLPVIATIRSDAGLAHMVRMQVVVQLPPWLQKVIGALLLLGMATCFYLILLLIGRFIP